METAYPRRGQLYWVHLPGEMKSKSRPALIMSPDIRNQLANDIILIPISSVLRPAPTHIMIRKGEGGLPRNSMAKCEQITTLRKDRISPKPLGGSLNKQKLLAIEKAVLRAIDIPIQ